MRASQTTPNKPPWVHTTPLSSSACPIDQSAYAQALLPTTVPDAIRPLQCFPTRMHVYEGRRLPCPIAMRTVDIGPRRTAAGTAIMETRSRLISHVLSFNHAIRTLLLVQCFVSRLNWVVTPSPPPTLPTSSPSACVLSFWNRPSHSLWLSWRPSNHFYGIIVCH